jgi:cellulose biosynthesis protein BcsQ
MAGILSATIAVYNMKGGVGKTTIAVNLAWMAATRSSRRTLLWDLDAQAASTFILSQDQGASTAKLEARQVITGEIDPLDAIRRTHVPRLDILPADPSLRSLDATFSEIDRRKQLKRILQRLQKEYDRIILDCPPGLGLTSDQITRSADMILLPMIPSPLSRKAYADVRAHLEQAHKKPPPIYPVFNMVDRRRSAHRAAVTADPGCPSIPMASAVEIMADRHDSVMVYAPKSPAAAAIAGLWRSIEQWLAQQPARPSS